MLVRMFPDDVYRQDGSYVLVSQRTRRPYCHSRMWYCFRGPHYTQGASWPLGAPLVLLCVGVPTATCRKPLHLTRQCDRNLHIVAPTMRWRNGQVPSSND